jgi:hypothetical protein
MENDRDNERLINKLIKKRKQENEAFIKLLNAIEMKSETRQNPKDTVKRKG